VGIFLAPPRPPSASPQIPHPPRRPFCSLLVAVLLTCLLVPNLTALHGSELATGATAFPPLLPSFVDYLLDEVAQDRALPARPPELLPPRCTEMLPSPISLYPSKCLSYAPFQTVLRHPATPSPPFSLAFVVVLDLPNSRPPSVLTATSLPSCRRKISPVRALVSLFVSSTPPRCKYMSSSPSSSAAPQMPPFCLFVMESGGSARIPAPPSRGPSFALASLIGNLAYVLTITLLFFLEMMPAAQFGFFRGVLRGFAFYKLVIPFVLIEPVCDS